MKILSKIYFFDKEKSGIQREYYFNLYIPQFQFSLDEGDFGGRIEFIGKEKVKPGEEVDALVQFVRPDYIEKYLVVGQEFKIFEGLRQIAEGEILGLINFKK